MNVSVRAARSPAVWGSLIVVAAYLVAVGFQMQDHYVIDEVVYPAATEGILEEGAPYFYNGETRPRDLAAWHPPLYQYALAGHVAVFGASRVSVRAFGVATVLMAYAVCLLALRRAMPDLAHVGVVAFSALFLWNPLVASNSLNPDIDGTVGMVAVAVAVLFGIRLITDETSKLPVVAACGVWLLVISTKFTLAFVMAPVLVGAAVLSPRRPAAKGLLVVASGVAAFGVFLLVFFGVARLAGFPVSAPFEYLADGWGRGGSGSLTARIIERLGPAHRVLPWLTPGLLLAAVVTGATLVVRRGGETARTVLFLLGAGAAVIVAYAAIAGTPFTFPKYQTVVVIPLALVAAMCFGQSSGSRDHRRDGVALAAGVVGVVAAGVLCVAVVGALGPRGRDVGAMTAATLALAVLLAVGMTLYAWTFRDASPVTSVALARIAPALAIAAIVASAIVTSENATAPYSTRYFVGERGLGDVIEHLRTETPRDAAIVAAKDVGIQSERRYYEDGFFLRKSPDDLRAALRTLPARYLVTRRRWDYSPVVFPAQFEVFPEFFEPLPRQPSPDLTIWERRSSHGEER